MCVKRRVTVLHVSLFHTFLFTSSSIFLSSAVFLSRVKDEWLISGFQPVLLFLQQSLADHVFITTALDMSVYHVLSEGFCQGVRLKASTMKSNIQYIGTSAQSLITLIKLLDFKNSVFTGLFDRERSCGSAGSGSVWASFNKLQHSIFISTYLLFSNVLLSILLNKKKVDISILLGCFSQILPPKLRWRRSFAIFSLHS